MRWSAWLVLIATLLLWSGNWIVARAVREEIAPGIATMGRLVIVLSILLPFALPGVKRKLGTLGTRDWKIIAALDMFWLTSDYEGLPISALEALALRVPIVATDVVGTRDLLRAAHVPVQDRRARPRLGCEGIKDRARCTSAVK